MIGGWNPSPEDIQTLLELGSITPETAAAAMNMTQQPLTPPPASVPPPDYAGAGFAPGGDWMDRVGSMPVTVAGPTPGLQYPTPEGINLDETGHLIAPEDSSPYASVPTTADPSAIGGPDTTVAAPNMPKPQPAPAPEGEITRTAQQGRRQEGIQTGIATQENAAIEGALAQDEARNNIVNERLKQAQFLKGEQELELKKQAEEDLRAKTAREEYEAALGEFQSTKEDPNRLWNSYSTGNKILAAIAIAMGGVAQGMGGGPNMALSLIMKAIDQDIEAQKNANDRKGRVTAAKGQLYNQLLDRFGNDRQARAALRAIQIESSKQTIESYAAEAKSAEQKAALMKLAGEAEVQKQKELTALDEAARREPEYLGEQMRTIMAGKNTPSAADVAKWPKEIQEKHVPGVGIAGDQTMVPKVIEGQKAYGDIKQLITELKILREGAKDKDGNPVETTIHNIKVPAGGFGAEKWNADAIAAAEALTGALKSRVRVAEEMGALDRGADMVASMMVPKNPLEFTRANVPMIGGLWKDPVVSRLDQYFGYVKGQYARNLKARMIYTFPGAIEETVDIPKFGPIKRGSSGAPRG